MFRLEIELGNAEMQDPAHVAEALRATANDVELIPPDIKSAGHVVRDANGNTVGRWTLEREGD